MSAQRPLWRVAAPRDLELRRALHCASHPIGAAAVLTAAIVMWPQAPLWLLPWFHYLPGAVLAAIALLLTAILAYAVVLAASGISRALGQRDAMLTVRAVCKITAAIFIGVEVWQWTPYGGEWWSQALLHLGLLIALWLFVTASVRLSLITLGLNPAQRAANRLAAKLNAAMRPANDGKTDNAKKP